MTPRKAVTSPKASAADPAAKADIRRAIARHGAKAVRSAVEELIPPRRGRSKIDDWPELTKLLDQDVREVLEQSLPFKRKNHAIARAFAAAAPGQSEGSTIRRIERKLEAKDSRRFQAFLRAWHESLDAHPYQVHVMILKELSAINPEGPWPFFLQAAEANVTAYRAKHGVPAETLSMSEIKDGARDTLRTGLLALGGGTAG